jgi:hypothetical protein
LTAVASSQVNPDIQWGSSGVNETLVVRYSPNGSYVLTAGGNQIRLWNASNGAFLWVRSVSNLVDAQFSANSSVVLASTTTDIRKVSVATGNDTGAFSADVNAKGYLALTPDGTMVAATLDGSQVNFYNSSTGALAGGFATSPGPSPAYLQFFQNGTDPLRVVVGTNAYNLDGTLWGAERGVTPGSSALALQRPADRRVFVLEGDGTTYPELTGMSATTGGVAQKSFAVNLYSTPTPFSGALHRFGRFFALAGNNSTSTSGQVILIDYVNATATTVATPYAGATKAIAMSPVDETFVLASKVGSTTTWKLEQYKLNATRTSATQQWVQSNNSGSPVTQVTVGPSNASVANAPIFVTGSTAPIASNPGTQVFNGLTGARVRTATETLLAGSRTRQLSVSTDGKYLAVVNSASGANLKVYNLQTGASVSYSAHVTGAAFLNATNLVVDGPTKLVVGASSVTTVSFPWGERGSIVDPAVSPDGTKVAMIDTFNGNDIVIFNTATGAATRYTNPDTLADYGFETNNTFWTLVRNNSGASNSARVRRYTVGATLAQISDRTTSIALLAGGGFTGWQVDESLSGKWAAMVATRTDASANNVNTVRFWNWQTNTQYEYTLPFSGAVGGVKFTADSSMLQIGLSDGSVVSLNVPVFPSALTLDPTTAIGGSAPSTATLTISEPGKIGGTIVPITGTANLIVPETATVPQGATQVTFLVKTNGVAANTTETVSATLNGVTKSATLALTPAVLKNVTFSKERVEGGDPVDATITITGKAPAGGSVVGLSYTFAMTGPATATIPEGENTVTINCTTKVVRVGTISRITATLNGSQKIGAIPTDSPAVTDLTLNNTEIVGGASLIGTVTISKSTTAVAGIPVTVTSDQGAATVPTVTVPKNATSVNFQIDTTRVAHDTTVTISAMTSNGVAKTKTFVIKAPIVTGLTLIASEVNGGSSTTGTVTLSSPAPAGGLLIDMSSNDSAITVDDVTVVEGATTAAITVNTSVVNDEVAGVITAAYDSSSATANLTVKAHKVSSVTLNTSSLKGGSGTTGTVTLSLPAPAGGLTVTMTSSDSSITVADVTFAEGETSKGFNVSTVPVSADVAGSVTGTYGTTSASANLTVLAPVVTVVGLSPTTVTGGQTAKVKINLDGPAPANFTFDITSSRPVYASVPSNVTFTPGATFVTFLVTTTTPPSTLTARITVTKGAFTASKRLTINP